MTSHAAAIGLLLSGGGHRRPVATPLARVVVGGMLTSAVVIPVVLPILYKLFHRSGAGDGKA